MKYALRKAEANHPKCKNNMKKITRMLKQNQELPNYDQLQNLYEKILRMVTCSRLKLRHLNYVNQHNYCVLY